MVTIFSYMNLDVVSFVHFLTSSSSAHLVRYSIVVMM
jgi:hypothetical protein